MKTTEVTITFLYFVLCIGIALYFRKRAGKGTRAYFGAEQSIGPWINGWATFSTLVSAGSFLGFIGFCYKFGWTHSVIALGVPLTLGFVLMLLFISGPLRKYSQNHSKFTLSEYFGERYSSKSSLISSIIICLLYPTYIVPQLIGGSHVTAYLLGIESYYAIFLISVIFIVYVIFGGMLSITWTDFFQAILMFGCMLGLTVIAFAKFGGVEATLAKALAVKPYFLSYPEKMPFIAFFGLALTMVSTAMCSPHVIMRVFTSRSVKEGRQAVGITAAIIFIFHVIGYLGVASAAVILFPALEQQDRTYIVVMDELFPTIMKGIATAAILAAIMSTTAGLLLATGAEFTNNIYKKYFEPEASDIKLVMTSKILMLIVGIATTVIAMLLIDRQNIGKLVGMVVGITSSSFITSILAGLWWKRANHRGALLSISSGFITYVLLLNFANMPPLSQIIIALPTSILFMILGSLATAPPSEKVQLLFMSLHE